MSPKINNNNDFKQKNKTKQKRTKQCKTFLINVNPATVRYSYRSKHFRGLMVRPYLDFTTSVGSLSSSFETVE